MVSNRNRRSSRQQHAKRRVTHKTKSKFDKLLAAFQRLPVSVQKLLIICFWLLIVRIVSHPQTLEIILKILQLWLGASGK